MHDTAMEIGKAFFDTYLKTDTSLTIVDVGAQDVNGSLRSVAPLNHKYIGLDFVDGKGVDVVITDPYNLPLESNSVDVVVCSSCFEHSEFFWLLFIEIQRILKPEGLFYLNAPSNGVFHRYPVDCWRFYPDSGIALQNWGRRNGYNTALLESFTGQQKQGIWNDFAGVFLKDYIFAEQYPNRIQTTYHNFSNGLVYGDDEHFRNYQEQPEDFKLIRDLEAKVHALDSESASRLQTIHDLEGKLTEATETHQLLAHQYQALIDYVHHKNVDLRVAETIFKKMYKNPWRKYGMRLLLGKKMNRRIRRWLKNANLGDPNIADISSGVPYDAPTDLSWAKVSIVLATYNGEKYLKEQLDSLLSQSHKNIEILIGDDQSTDGTISIVKEYQKNHPFIHLYQHEHNLGCSKNFEFLCTKAEGDYIAFSDQDDLWHQDKIKNLLQNIGECDLAYGPSQLVNRDGFDLGKTLLQRNGFLPLQGRLIKGLEKHNTISGHAMLCKASFIKQNVPIHVSRVNGHDDIFFDYYFALCANFQNGIKYVPEAITFHRMHENNLTNNPDISSKEKQDLEIEMKVHALDKYIYDSQKILKKLHKTKLRKILLRFLIGKKNNRTVKLLRQNSLLGMDKSLFFHSKKNLDTDEKSTPDFGILTTKHCLYIANSILRCLVKAGFNVEIILDPPASGFRKIPYFVICPQMFDKLPDKYYAIQMEQSVSSRWFNKNYMDILKKSECIFDFSIKNIDFLVKNDFSYKKIYYLPLSYFENTTTKGNGEINSNYEYDVIFYGDIHNERRKKFLAELQKNFTVKVINNLFGEELLEELKKGKIVVNIHYYENALLETTRIYECLSLNCLIVSEKSADFEEHLSLQNIVDFVDIGDVHSMVNRISFWLDNDSLRQEKIEENFLKLKSLPNSFEYYFFRFLLAYDFIEFEKFYSLASPQVVFKGNFICLSLPESTKRYQTFIENNQYDIEIFSGLRHKIGWIGCALSYKFLLRKADELNLENIIICEDDVEFLEGWFERFLVAKKYLAQTNNNWDIFSGLIADLSKEVSVKKIENYKGEEFIYLDKMVSMVFNVYNKSFFKKLNNWSQFNYDANTNTIDRFIESHNTLKTVSTVPFIVGHKEDLHSTLWGEESAMGYGIPNTQYNKLITESEELLKNKKGQYLALKALSPPKATT